MAKIFKTEILSLNADNIRLTSDNPDEWQFENNAEQVVLSSAGLANATGSLVSDVSSLSSSVANQTGMLISDVSSLSSSVANQTGMLISDVSSLHVKDQTLDSDVSSLAKNISTENVFATGVTLTDATASQKVDWGEHNQYDPATAPAVVATLRSTEVSDPIYGVMLSGSATTGSATFLFTDELQTANYILDVLASV